MRKFLFYVLCIFLSFISIALIIKPAEYSKACLDGIILWATVVMPSLLPFFFISLLMTNTGMAKALTNKLKRPTALLYNVNSVASFVQLMSFISGYPVGAKLISQLYNEGQITSSESTKISLFTSTSGPMFIVGSVGALMFNDKNKGIVLLICHFLSAILNGIIFRKYTPRSAYVCKNIKPHLAVREHKNILYDCAYGATISCLTVGAFIAVFFVFCKIASDFNLLYPFTAILTLLFKDTKKARAFCAGLIECTNGCALFASTSGFLTLPLTAFIISFGGMSIIIQSIAFLKQAKADVKMFIFSKTVQAFTSFFICSFMQLLL